MKPALSKAGKWLLNALLPRACLHCGEDLPYLDARPLCAACAGALEPLPELHCSVCGLPLREGGRSCRDCRGRGAGSLALARSAFVFNPQLRSVVHAFKYRAREDLAGFLAAEMTAALGRFPELAPHAFALPVPLHPSRARERGFDQACLLARGLAGRAGLFCLEGAAARARNTPSQTSLSKEERRANVAGAFHVERPELVKGRKILLVDDVATTLATLDALAGELLKAGAKSVAAYTLAREPLP
jgi:ComF family protein